MDLPGAADNLKELAQRFPDREIIAISAERADGISVLRDQLAQWLADKTEESRSENMVGAAEVVIAE
jgi:predicted GTPase